MYQRSTLLEVQIGVNFIIVAMLFKEGKMVVDENIVDNSNPTILEDRFSAGYIGNYRTILSDYAH